MKWMKGFWCRVSPLRALAESWLVCSILIVPLLPVVLETTRFARSLSLILVPLICALYASIRGRLFCGKYGETLFKEAGLAVGLAGGLLGIILGLFALLGAMDSIRYSFAGLEGTIYFILLAMLEYLGMRALRWVWRRWDSLRRQRYVWALTHAFLVGLGVIGGILIIATMIYLAFLFKSDIWEIPADSFFAQAVFWISIFLLVAFALFSMALILFLPPALLFSFLVARKMTRRVESLAQAVRTLRQGDLTKRVDVAGKDEIAQLQTDFNAMAVGLEKSMLALQAEKDKVYQLLETRRELVADVSHELRNPTATILGYSDALRRNWKELSSQEIERDLGSIQYEASRLQTILNDLLTASQTETGRLSLELKTVEVTEPLRRLVEIFAGLAWSSKRVQVTLSAPKNEVFAQADAVRLEQVLVNLLQNAIRHTSPGGLVTIEIQQTPGGVLIGVEDTGEGILAQDLPHIWEKYYQSGSPSQRAKCGVGLGLALVKELTEAMGGSVAVESKPGEGSLFSVLLPLGFDGSLFANG